jgi:KUP system potassium uptake protein
MVVSSLLAIVVIANGWKWGLGIAVAVVAPFLLVESAFLLANLLKIFEGGWLPIVIASIIMIVMGIWMRGTRIVTRKAVEGSESMTDFAETMQESSVMRVPGTAIFLTSTPSTVPDALLHNLKHNHVLHARNVILTVRTTSSPYVADSQRAKLSPLDENFWLLEVRYGFLEEPNILKALIHVREGLKFDIMSTTFFVGRRSIKAGRAHLMPRWQRAIFIKMARHSYDAIDYFQIPANRVVELGTRMNL